MRQVHIQLSGEMGSGKTTIATIIRQALKKRGIPATIDDSVGNYDPAEANHLITDDVEVTIAEDVRNLNGGAVLKEGTFKDALAREKGL
jgi:ABC-type glutathione transport system ATPase component